MGFDGSAIDGFSRVQESDVLAKPDPNSFELLPWADSYGTSARMFCDITNIDGTPFEGDPRQVLRRRSEEHTSELQSLMRISYAVFCLKNKTKQQTTTNEITPTNNK